MITTNLRRKIKRNKLILICLGIFIAFSLLILQTELSPDLYFINFGVEDVSCHYRFSSELEAVDNNFAPAFDSIFFHETSCRGSLNSRQLCSIESAARANPNREIYVFFSSPVSLKTEFFYTLKRFNNVMFKRLNIVEYAKRTPVADLVRNGALNRTRWPVSHTSDVLRFITLFKWGGVYLDLDVVVARSLDELPKNWVALESDFYVASSLLACRDNVGGMLAEAILSDLAKNYRGDIWAHNGPAAVTRAMKKLCSTKELSAMSAETCKGIEVFKTELFFPISWEDAFAYFMPGDISQDPYMYHVWNKITHDTKLSNDSVYAKLARKYCPSVYDAYGSHFGN